ncbi:MAG: RagB/SusD family nutrient uptake outer membrane protein [Chitinophagaceae bacterium]
MRTNNKIILASLFLILAGCSKLDEDLRGTLTSRQASSALGASGTDLLLKAAYTNLTTTFHDQARLYSLQENTSDESLVVTRGGDWDDNGAWRVLHNHTWDANHDQLLQVFNGLNKLNFDATNVLNFNPSKSQTAEARFLRALSLYFLLDLYGQYPFRDPGANLLNAPEVKSGAAGMDFIISELTAILPDLNASNPITVANPDAARVLLMKCYLQKGAIVNRETPTFAAADMQQVITLGNTIINSNKYSYTPNYFDNFSVDNGQKSKEGIFAYPNTSGVTVNSGGIQARWNHTLHYNSFDKFAPNAGWNGFATVSDFYNSFSPTNTTTYGPADTLLDQRIGGRYYQGATNVSGIRPGLLVGQQFNAAGVALKDRKGAPLAFTPEIAPDMIEKGANLEVTGIRVVKYVPDYTDDSKNYQSNAGNWLMIFRYADVVLMVAEARLRTGDAATALTLVNGLRQARSAALLPSISLVNTANLYDPNTLIAERGRELYHESFRRTDLIRFGVFLKPWQYKPTDNPKNLVFPIPAQALASNPNFKQNKGY